MSNDFKPTQIQDSGRNTLMSKLLRDNIELTEKCNQLSNELLACRSGNCSQTAQLVIFEELRKRNAIENELHKRIDQLTRLLAHSAVTSRNSETQT